MVEQTSYPLVSAKAQRLAVKARLHLHTDPKEQETWFALPAQWYSRWKEAVDFEAEDDQSEIKQLAEQFEFDSDSDSDWDDDAGQADDEVFEPVELPAIDLSSISDEKCRSMLRADVQELADYVLVHSSVWRLLKSWYGVKSGHKEISRKTAKVAGDEVQVQTRPFFFCLNYLDEEGQVDDARSSETISFNPDESVGALVERVRARMQTILGLQAHDVYVRLWVRQSLNGRKRDFLSHEEQRILRAAVKAPPAKKGTPKKDVVVEKGSYDFKRPLDELLAEMAGNTELKATEEPYSEHDDALVDTQNGQYALLPLEQSQFAEPLAALSGVSPMLYNTVLVDWFRADRSSSTEKGSYGRVYTRRDWRSELTRPGAHFDVLDKYCKWYEAVVTPAGDGVLRAHFIGWSDKFNEKVKVDDTVRIRPVHSHTLHERRKKPKTKPATTSTTSATGTSAYSGAGRSAYSYYGGSSYGGYGSRSYYNDQEGTPAEKGVVGLRNLGNTCFMNSTLQCLSNTPGLAHFFFRGDKGLYLRDINSDNPLGRGGKVARAYGDLMRRAWSGKYTLCIPRKVKETIGEFAPRFMGYQQHDSSELLSFLLDGLHEDLNRVLKKPYTTPVEDEGRPDVVVAAQSWGVHKQRNQSVIVDLLQGQFKSRVCCPECPKVSVTFDPFMFLSVPLPTSKQKRQLVYFVENLPPAIVSGDASDWDEIRVRSNITVLALNVKGTTYMRSLASEVVGELQDMSSLEQGEDEELTGAGPAAGIDPRRVHFLTRLAYSSSYRSQWDMVADNTIVNELEASEDLFAFVTPRFDATTHVPLPESEVVGQEELPGVEYNLMLPVKIDNGRKSYSMPEVPCFLHVPEEQIVPKAKSYTLGKQALLQSVRVAVRPMLQCTALDDTALSGRVRLVTTSGGWYSRKKHETVIDLDDDEDGEIEVTARTTVYFEPSEQAEKHLVTDLFLVKKHFGRHKTYVEFRQARGNRSRYSAGYSRDGADKEFTLEQCLDAFTERETLSEADAWYCPDCKKHVCADKKFDLGRLPDVLIIHIKRFCYSSYRREKLSNQVHFPLEGLDLSPWCIDEDSVADGRGVYDLYAVSNHMGGLGGGHYTAYAKNFLDHKWYHFDDSSASRVSDLSRIVSPSAYVLYYVRRKADTVQRYVSSEDLPVFEEIDPLGAAAAVANDLMRRQAMAEDTAESSESA